MICLRFKYERITIHVKTAVLETNTIYERAYIMQRGMIQESVHSYL